MLEQPLPMRKALFGRGNRLQLLMRYRHMFQKHENPNNGITLSTEQYGRYFKFTVVRNPWGRAYSWYRNCLRDPNHRKRFHLTQDTPLRQFLQRQAGRGALRPQTEWLKDFNGGIPLNFIARFEVLEEDFAEICSRLVIGTLPLPHERKGSGDEYHDHYDAESKKIVENLYREEIELFGYSFGS